MMHDRQLKHTRQLHGDAYMVHGCKPHCVLPSQRMYSQPLTLPEVPTGMTMQHSHAAS
jgi:hypothetical protein